MIGGDQGAYDCEGHVEAVEEEEEEGAGVGEDLVLDDVEDEVGDDEQGRALLERPALRHLHERLLQAALGGDLGGEAPRRRDGRAEELHPLAALLRRACERLW
jgi:hypothetical protein